MTILLPLFAEAGLKVPSAPDTIPVPVQLPPVGVCGMLNCGAVLQNVFELYEKAMASTKTLIESTQPLTV